MSQLTLTVASWFDREDLVVEIESGDEDFGLVTYDHATGSAILELYPRASNEDWRFDLREVRDVLERAERRIMEVAGPLPDERQHEPSDGDPLAQEGAAVESNAGARVSSGA